MAFEVITKSSGGAKRQALARIMFANGGRVVFITLTGALVEQAGLGDNVDVLVGSGPDYGQLCIRQTDSPFGRHLNHVGPPSRNHRRISVTPLRPMFVGHTPFAVEHEIRDDGLYLRIPPDRLVQQMPEAAE